MPRRMEGTCAQGCCSVTKSCWTLGDPSDYSPPGSSVHGISQAEHWRGLLFPSPGESSRPRDQTRVSCTAGGFLAAEPPGKPGWLNTHISVWAAALGLPASLLLLLSICPSSPSSRQTTHLVYFTLHHFPISPTWVLQFTRFKPASVPKTASRTWR